MKICILGVGRSGTTALYQVLQEILIDQLGPHGVDFFYEPFLWSMDTFNDRYANVSKRFESMNSVSVDGMYHHQHLPMFITDPTRFRDNPYLKRIFSGARENTLVKFIRANGRFRLLADICPECKFIFIIRNPLDVINSAVVRFSFFGSEFHRDDWQRFAEEVRSIFGHDAIDGDTCSDPVGKELLYWFFFNRFALETFRGAAQSPLLIGYEDYICRREFWIDRICDFLALKREDAYHRHAKRVPGTQTKSINLTEPEINRVLPYLEKYAAMLNSSEIAFPDGIEGIAGRYRSGPAAAPKRRLVIGQTPSQMNNEIRSLEMRLSSKEHDLEQKTREMDELLKRLNAADSEIRRLKHALGEDQNVRSSEKGHGQH